MGKSDKLMVNEEKKFIFIHIPKTGGSSIEKALGLKGFQHDTHAFYSDEKYGQYFKFTVVRNPWDKVVSDYEWMINNYIFLNGFAVPCPKVKEVFVGRGFNFFVKALLEYDYLDLVNEKPELVNYRSEKWFHMHFASHRQRQLDFLQPIEKINFIAKFENLQSDFDKICGMINLPKQILPHKNKTRRKQYKDYYDEESYNLVKKFYEKDIDYFSYTF